MLFNSHDISQWTDIASLIFMDELLWQGENIDSGQVT